MKIHWFSPLPPAKSEIGMHTLRLLPALAAEADVTVWTEQQKWDPRLKQFAEVRSYSAQQIPWQELNREGVAVYNVGNHPEFHGLIWRISQMHPGIVVLHDLILQGLFAGYYSETADVAGYLRIMGETYGPEGRRMASQLWTGQVKLNELSARFPLTLHGVGNPLGVVVHTPEAFEILRREQRWPVCCIPLPYAVPDLPAEADAAKWNAGPPYRLIVFGYINAHRRLESVFRALSSLDCRDDFRLDVYGPLWDEAYIRGRVSELGLENHVTIHGFVAEEKLEAALANAHLAINLRFPTMGEASASQIRIWSHALPSLVTPVGWYACLGTESVDFVRPDPQWEHLDLQRHLGALRADPLSFAKRGLEGYRILKKRHGPENYARAVIRLISAAQSSPSTSLVQRLLERVGTEMHGWMGRRFTPESTRHVANEILTLAQVHSPTHLEDVTKRAA